MRIDKQVIETWIEYLENSECSFWMCEGYENPPKDMITCNICRTIWEMKKCLSNLAS